MNKSAIRNWKKEPSHTKAMSVLPSNHGRVLLHSRLQQPLQNGPFPHGDGKVVELSGETGFGERTPLPPADSFFFLRPAGALVDLPVRCMASNPCAAPAPFWPLHDYLAALWCLWVSSPGPVALCFSSWWRRAADLIASPSSLPRSLNLSPSPPPCAVMLVLPLPHHSVLRYSICYSSLYTAMVTLSFHFNLVALLLFSPSALPLPPLSLPSSSTLPPGHSL